MAKPSVSYVCRRCGGAHRSWSGRCDHCGAWNTLVEERVESPSGPGKKVTGRRVDMQPLATSADTSARMKTVLGEFGRVSGGLVAGSATLIGGDPGIGKSTLLLQLFAALSAAAAGARAAYVSGEESAEQVACQGPASRAWKRRSRPCDQHQRGGHRRIHRRQGRARGRGHRFDPDDVPADAGLGTGHGQPGPATAQELIRGKDTTSRFWLSGMVTKDGAIAGPRVLEHMVDTGLYFEGDRSHHFRILRGVKNRFGATDEIGVFEMAEKGLVEVPNPSNCSPTGVTR